ncbi:MAG: sugar phosphorylase [Sedimentisphaerales bacterium]|nr:sugar phosphorylase [Sedimentisphaerales bacterium]
MLKKIGELYGAESVEGIAGKLEGLLGRYGELRKPSGERFLSEKDIFLITYADSLRGRGISPLQCLNGFVRDYLGGLVSIVHLLPCFPYSSDDGFSVIDYRVINPDCGSWSDVEALAENVDLCFDLVLNHVSAGSDYFKGFLAGDPKYQDFFITLDPGVDTSSVLRPRVSPLLHRFETAAGEKWCWTTFSADQLDLNFSNPEVLLEMLDILLLYVSRGGRMIRLDAIAYLWKELGTSCAHLPQTHLVVQLMRDVVEKVAPGVLLLTETNVPHQDNIAYFGDGWNEAQVVYNFPLPPLVLYSIVSGDAGYLSRWAESIKPVSRETTFLNFTASHDGIGVRPVADILPVEEFGKLLERVVENGGSVSYKNDQDGQPIPYELNINYFDALNNAGELANETAAIDRFMLSQSIPLVLLGMPAVYIHSLLGSRNWSSGVKQTGQARSINREKLDLEQVEKQLNDPGSLRGKIFVRYAQLLKLRRGQKAFHPLAEQKIHFLDERCFAVQRSDMESGNSILALHNVSAEKLILELDGDLLGGFEVNNLFDLITGRQLSHQSHHRCRVELGPFEFVWLSGL